MANDPDLAAKLHEVIRRLEQVDELLRQYADQSTGLRAIVEALESIDDELFLLRQRAFPQPQPRSDEPSWPWTPDTVSQGFLAGRWLRRDGNVYGIGVLRGVRDANSPIAGGQDHQAKVSVPSGAPRIEQ